MPEIINTTFLTSIDRTYNVKSFRFDDLGGVNFRPGQFFQLFLDWEGEELSHFFSFSNSPTEKGYIEFTKKLSDSPFSHALLSLQPGTPVRIKLPMGIFVFEGEYPKVTFLSGGIGITPIRSICKYLTDTGSSSEATILYSARTSDDFVFQEDFAEMRRQDNNLSFVYSVTGEEIPEGWIGRTGAIDARMIKEEIPDFSERVFYVCGPPGMVKAMVSMLKEDLSLPADRIVHENFMGY
ncbi:MAG: FAD-dependent oxidoreductase [Candidatus Auribacterota bacterium]|nr:FAD-dependent oxidoreductase [Candidatus Auribacterota bacterium]